jgi:hypothetical protein
VFSDKEIQSVDPAADRTGIVVEQGDEGRCELMKFNNDDGRVIDNVRHCEKNSILDARGVPVPVGTIHRLDAISKSFSKDAH